MANTPPKAPTDRQPKAHVLEARKQRALQEYAMARDLDRDASMREALAADPNHPFTEEAAANARADAKARKESAKELLAKVGQTEADALRSMKQQRIETLRQQIEQWSATRDIHADYAENPDEWGGKTQGGEDIDVDTHRRAVKEYEAAIAAAKAELTSLQG